MEMSAAALRGNERLMPGPSQRDELQGNRRTLPERLTLR